VVVVAGFENEMGEKMMRALYLRVGIGIFAATSLAAAAYAQAAAPKYPKEIAAVSSRIAERNEDCRRQAREQHLQLINRYASCATASGP
jgi:hypothetical protein